MGIKVTLTEEQMDDFLDSFEMMTAFNLLFDDEYEEMQSLGTKYFKDIENKTVVKNSNDSNTKISYGYINTQIFPNIDSQTKNNNENGLGIAA